MTTTTGKVQYLGSEWWVAHVNDDGTLTLEQARRYSDGDSIAVANNIDPSEVTPL